MGLALAVVLAALLLGPELAPVRALRLAVFDAYQALAPRPPSTAPVAIVEIDDASLARFGQWPWPRTKLAQLVAAIADGRPAAIGLDLVMPEPDRFSPDRLSGLIPGLGADLGRELARLPDSDRVLGATLARIPAVVGLVGLARREPGSVVVLERAPVRVVGGSPEPFLPHFAAALRSVEPIARGASGQGLINASPDGRVVRRSALAATVGDAIIPALAVEMLRVASGAPALVVRTGPRGVETIGPGTLAIPTAPDGSVWIHFAVPDPSHIISAADLLTESRDPRRFEGALVLIGVTAVGLGDRHATPVAPSMVGVEIHAQLLEGILDGDLLVRPRWARWIEAAVLAFGAGWLILAVPAWPVGRSALLAVALTGLALLCGFAVYRRWGVLLDGAGPALGIAVTYAAMLGIALIEVQRQRRSLRRQLENEQEATARVAGELEAARRIQMGILPVPADVVGNDDRIAIHAFVEAARIVGGDFYDFFRLDADRLFFLVGDVSGDGVAGSLFMAVSKALCKSAGLRHSADLGAVMREANVEIARDNPETLFVTVWAGVLDARTGRLQYCSAGHEPAWLLSADGSATQPLTQGAGPPLCVIDGFPYAAASYRLRPGETLCLVTDGVTEATDVTGELYGRARLGAVLAATPPSASVRQLGEAIGADVARFVHGAEPSDDLTVLVVRWNGA